MSVKSKIGILGGMGPEASSNFYQKIIEICQEKYSAVQDTDYPNMLIYSLGLDGFDETGIVDKELVLKQLIDGILLLNNAGVDFIFITCNTVHCFIDELRNISKTPIFSIVEETAKKIKNSNINSVALLASEASYNLKLYDSAFEKENINIIKPPENGKKLLTKSIMKVMSGAVSEKTKNKLLLMINNLNAEAIVLGCTELPLIINQNDVSIKLFDSLQILAESALEYYFKLKSESLCHYMLSDLTMYSSSSRQMSG